MIDKYIKLRREREECKEELKSFLKKSKTRVQEIDNFILYYEDTLLKGSITSVVTLPQLREEKEKVLLQVLNQTPLLKKSLLTIEQDLEAHIRKNPSLKYFENFDTILKTEDFKKSVVTLSKSIINEEISKESAEEIQKSLLKFREVEVEKEKYMVKDNRKCYADLVILNQDNQILFVRRNKDDDFEPGKYALPGGHVEPAEDPKIAAIREVQEEVSLTIDVKSVFPVGMYEDTQSVINYYCTKLDSVINIPILEERELIQYEWVDLDKITTLPLLMNLRENFEKVIEIPVVLLENTKTSEEVALFYGAGGEGVIGTGYPI